MYSTVWIVACLAIAHSVVGEDYANNTSVQLLQQYVQINTTTYNDLTDAVEFWRGLAAEADLEFNVYELSEGFPIIVIRWPGSDCSQYSIMLNSHMDVVPADEADGWTYPPFSGYLDENNDIYGRGTQDMKSVSIQYYEAIRYLKEQGTTLLRDVYMTLMPDEEVGAEHGMRLFLESDVFAAMNVGVEMDEGTSYDLPLISIFYQDKVPWQIQVDCYGTASHGSTLPETNATATGRCHNVVNQMLAFRDEEYEISKTAPINNAGIYSSVNFNKVNGGTANNVIPSHVSLVFDIRLDTSLNETELQTKLENIIASSGDNITLSYILKDKQSPATLISTSNPYWTAISSAATSRGVTLLPTVPPGSTDARFVRSAGIPSFGFSPMPNTPLLLHSVNEHLNAAIFLQGIELYKAIIFNLGTISADATAAPSNYLVATA